MTPPIPPLSAAFEGDAAGDGTRLVLIHSSGLGAAQFRSTGAALGAQGLRVWALDLPGYGASPPWPSLDGFTFAWDVEAIERFILDLGAPVALFGHSYGGFLAGHVALRRRVPLTALALWEPVLFSTLATAGLPTLADDLGGEQAFADFFALDEHGAAGWLERFIDYWQGRGAWRRLNDRQRAPMLATAERIYAEVSTLAVDTTNHGDLARLDLPTLTLSGDLSPPAARRLVALLADTIPGAERVTFAEVGHMGPITHRAAFEAALVDFLRRRARA